MTLYDSDEGVKAWMESRGTCQNECLEPMMELSLRTLFGHLHVNSSLDLYKAHAKEAITGAVKACWPSLPRKHVKTIVHGIVELWVVAPTEPVPFEIPGRPCGNASGFPMDDFYNFMDEAFTAELATDSVVKHYFDNVAKTCQHECKDMTIPLAAATMFR